jgi:hypothetical protein
LKWRVRPRMAHYLSIRAAAAADDRHKLPKSA